MKPKDFDEKLSNGFVGMILSAVFYFVVPVVYFALAPDFVPAEADISGIDELMSRWMVAGIPLVILAFPRKYYAYGNIRRVYTCILTAIMSVVWILYVTNMGDLDGIVSFDNGDIGFTLSLGFFGFIVLIAAYKVLKIVIAYADHKDNREAYEAENGSRKRDGDGIRVPGRFN